MKTKLITILLAFLFVNPVMGQEKIEYNGDTLIAISPKNLKTINGIIVSWEFLKKELMLKDSLLAVDSVLLNVKDSTIMGIENREKKKEAWYIESKENLIKEAKRQKKVKTLLGGGVGAIIGLIIGLLL